MRSAVISLGTSAACQSGCRKEAAREAINAGVPEFAAVLIAGVQAELDEVVGSERLPEWSDRRNLPYTQAAINEVMRLSAIVSTGTTHSNQR